jgi:aryl sulfotransferase
VSGIYWLASYPKSGNTWLRVFLASFRSGRDEPVDINQLKSTPIATARSSFDEAVGVESSDLTHDEIDSLRPDVYEHIASEAEEDLFIKVHDAFSMIGNRALLGGPSIRGAIYIVRNPLDVAVSLAGHIGSSLDESIEHLNDPSYCFCGDSTWLAKQLRHRLLSWTDHVLSWVDAPRIRVHVMRYEDMRSQPEETFGAAAAFLGLPREPERIRTALRHSDLGALQRMEREHGFRERSPHAGTFFGPGLVGGYRGVLTPEQVAAVVQAHAPAMRRFGYLSEGGQVTC